MSKSSVLITGASKGIGYETARQMGQSGYRVWLGSRDPGRGQLAVDALVAEGIDARLVSLDVTDDKSVEAASRQVLHADGKLDVLINNAGIPGDYPVAPSAQSIRNIMAIYDTNVFGAIRVTQAFLPLLKNAAGAQVIMVSSGLGSLAWVSDPEHPYSRVDAMGYNSSKTALNAVTVAFAKELREFAVSVNAVDPGYTATDFNGHTGYRTVQEAAAGIVWLAGLRASDVTAGFYFDRERAPW